MLFTFLHKRKIKEHIPKAAGLVAAFERRYSDSTPGKAPAGIYFQDRDINSSTAEAMRILIEGNAKKAWEMLQRAKNPGFVPEMLRFIDEQKRRDTSVYKAAHIDRRLYSKIVSNRDYKPARDTCIALILALHLPQEKAAYLFGTAGYAFSLSDGRDLVILYCIHEKIWDIDDINELLRNLNYRPIGRQNE